MAEVRNRAKETECQSILSAFAGRLGFCKKQMDFLPRTLTAWTVKIGTHQYYRSSTTLDPRADNEQPIVYCNKPLRTK